MATPKGLAKRGEKLRILKVEGHDLLTKVARKHGGTGHAYRLLKEELKLPPDSQREHFYNMHTIPEVERAIKALERIHQRPKAPRPDILPLAKQKEAIAVLPIHRPRLLTRVWHGILRLWKPKRY